MIKKIQTGVFLLICWLGFGLAEGGAEPATQYKIAFGSCADQSRPLPIFHEILKQRPDVFIFLGDNVYGDTRDMDVLRRKYRQLGEKESYRKLKAQTEILAIWDDHDYGENDAGKHYPKKEESKQVFLEFFEEPTDSPRRKHAGIYHAEYRKVGGKTVQILLLDMRSFRDDLLPTRKRSFYKLDYAPHTDRSMTLLGEAQWKWLAGELRKPADVRLLATGTQFGIEYNGYESWANFPHEQQRLVQLIASTRAEGVLILSGDVHYGEISKWNSQWCYPLYDLTASGLSKRWHFATPNKNRIEGPVMDHHFGLLTIDFSADNPHAKAEIWDIRGNQRVEYQIPLKELTWGKAGGSEKAVGP